MGNHMRLNPFSGSGEGAMTQPPSFGKNSLSARVYYATLSLTNFTLIITWWWWWRREFSGGVARWSHKILLSRASNAFLIAKMRYKTCVFVLFIIEKEKFCVVPANAGEKYDTYEILRFFPWALLNNKTKKARRGWVAAHLQLLILHFMYPLRLEPFLFLPPK